MTLVVGVFCSSWNKCAYGGDWIGVWNGYLARAFLGSEARHRNLVYVETGYLGTVALGYYGRRISLFVSRRLDYYSSVASMRESDGWIAVSGSVSRLHD